MLLNSLYLESKNVDEDLTRLIQLLAKCTEGVSEIIKRSPVQPTGTANAFGDLQLSLDIQSDELIFDLLSSCADLVAYAASEESPDLRLISSTGKFTLVFDPLDGSSIVDCNWTVGSIFGVFQSSPTIVGMCGRDQLMSAVSVYGPRTTLIIAVPQRLLVFEATLVSSSHWVITNEFVNGINNDAKFFSPANLRSASELSGYANLIDEWSTQRRLTLRYTGGLVPDVVGILIKGSGIFCSPVSLGAPAKLRLVFECAPIALIVETAGGVALTGEKNEKPLLLDKVISSLDDRAGIICGSRNEVLHALDVICD